MLKDLSYWTGENVDKHNTAWKSSPGIFFFLDPEEYFDPPSTTFHFPKDYYNSAIIHPMQKKILADERMSLFVEDYGFSRHSLWFVSSNEIVKDICEELNIPTCELKIPVKTLSSKIMPY